jgi:hypothetical protein
VYRAYDTRFRFTHRRPDLYRPDLYAKFAPLKENAKFAALEESDKPDVMVVCRVRDRDHDAGEDAPSGDGVGAMDVALQDNRLRATDDTERMKWMWTLQGELVVISVPFVEGNHFASTVKDFLPVVKSLQSLHKEGYVHGDIRCFNIIFGKGLIDFDFGGLVDKAKYPTGYQHSLPDGHRLGRAGTMITKWHDWHALIDVIFTFHHLEYPKGETNDMRDRLHEFHMYKCPDVVEDIATALESFLDEAKETWTVTPTLAFQAILKECGMLFGKAAGTTNHGPWCPATETATPSPPDKKKMFP